jgi:predicted Zn-dependent protease
MKKMGRHPLGQEEMLRTMRRINRYTMGNNVPQYLLTHPHPELRLDYVQALVAYEEKELMDLPVTEDFAFLRMKYRILSMVKEGKRLRNLLHNHLADSSLTENERVMLHYGLSQLDYRENNYDSSRKLLQEVIAHYPEKSILLVDLGLVEMGAGHKERALGLIQSGYDRNRYDMWATFQLARIWLALGNLGKAEKYLQEVQGSMPDYSKVYFEIGKLKATQGETGTASYYLGKYNLYEGRLKIARQNLQVAWNDPELDATLKADIETMRELMDRLQKN